MDEYTEKFLKLLFYDWLDTHLDIDKSTICYNKICDYINNLTKDRKIYFDIEALINEYYAIGLEEGFTAGYKTRRKIENM